MVIDALQPAGNSRKALRVYRYTTNRRSYMCLAIPAKITQTGDDNLAIVDILGATREISLDLTPQAGIGDYVLVHAGFAIEVVDEQFAQETIDLIREFPELAEEETGSAAYANDAGDDDANPEQGAQQSQRSQSPTSAMQDALAVLAEEL